MLVLTLMSLIIRAISVNLLKKSNYYDDDFMGRRGNLFYRLFNEGRRKKTSQLYCVKTTCFLLLLPS